MRAGLGLLLLLLAAAPLAAQQPPQQPQQPQQPQVDPALRRLLQPEVAAPLAQLRIEPEAPAAEQPLGGTLALDVDDSGRTRVGVFIEPASAAQLAALRALGAEIGSVAGEMATARVPLDVLPQVLQLPLRRVQAARMLRTLHDSSMVAIGAHTVRQRVQGGWTGATGAGVIFGIIDSGLDIRHPDFIDDAGRSRVLAVWDQTFGASPPSGFFYGFLCTADAIQAVVLGPGTEACPTQDFVGHGTHVTGTAAGDGGRTGAQYAGVAPEAALLVVKGGNTAFAEDRVADGLVWLRDEARRRGMPAVVNLSLGQQGGPHDGSTFLERFIDLLSDPGFIVVLAAGNDGANRNVTPPLDTPPRLIHARVEPVAGATHTIEFRIAPYTPNVNRCGGVFVELSAWYDVRDRVEITVVRPNGTSLTVAAGQSERSDNQQGRIEIVNAAPLQAYATTAEAYIQLNGCPPSGVPAAGLWRIRFRALPPTGTVTGVPIDTWLLSAVLGPGGSAFGVSGFDNRLLIGSPGSARRGITVGAFVTRVCWPSLSAPTFCYTNRPVVGDLAPFSSAGPTRDGRMKPEITAPGMGIVSTLSRHTNAPPSRVVPDSLHWLLEGTSMAAPHVAGAVALLLEQRPWLAPEDVRDVLTRSARQDAFTVRAFDTAPAARPSDWWGAGKLDVPAALQALLGGGAVVALELAPAVDTIPLGGFGHLRATARDATDAPVFAALEWTSTNPAVAPVDNSGRVEGRQLGSTLVIARSGAAADTARVVVAPPAVLLVTARPAAPAAPLFAPAGTMLPLLALRLQASGPEAVDVRALGFEVTGTDAGARLVLLDDPDGDGVPDDASRVIAGVEVELDGAPRTVVLETDTLFVPRNGVRNIIAAVQVSGEAESGATFHARLVPGLTRTVTLNSRLADRVQHGDAPAAGTGTTTVLRPDELFALSANPVRGDNVNLTFATRPTLAAVHTVTGSRVADLLPRFDGLSYRWDLTNDNGERIVPGVYLLVFRVDGRLVRQRLFVLSPQVQQ